MDYNAIFINNFKIRKNISIIQGATFKVGPKKSNLAKFSFF